MIRILSLLSLILIIAQCTVSPKATPNQSYKLEGSEAWTDESMRHGWAQTDEDILPKTKEFEEDEDAIARGAELYKHHCAQCHGPSGKGDGKLAEALKIKPANLQKLNPKLPNYYLNIEINHGKGSMPQWKDFLTSKQTWDLTQYVLYLSKKK